MNKLLVSSLFLVAACGTKPAAPTATLDAAAPAGGLSLAPIQKIEASAPADGRITVTVSYWLHCESSFDHLETKGVAPYSLSNPHVAVGVWTTAPAFLCLAADRLETATFTEPAIAGMYSFLNETDAGKAWALQFSAAADRVTVENTLGDAVQELATLSCVGGDCQNGNYHVVRTGDAATLTFVDQPYADVVMTCQDTFCKP